MSGKLNAVSTVSSSDVWAVGASGTSTLIEHWDGSRWSIVSSPSPGNAFNTLQAISGTGASDQWAVGFATNLVGPDQYMTNVLIEHWNGLSWQSVSVPQVAGQLLGVKAVSVSDAWAVGYLGLPGNEELVLHWDGLSWTHVPTPSNNFILNGLNQRGSGLHWAAGEYALGGVGNAQMLHFVKTSASWKPVPTQATQGNSIWRLWSK